MLEYAFRLHSKTGFHRAPRKWENYRNHCGTPARDNNIIAADNSIIG